QVIQNGTAAQNANFHVTGNGIVDGNVGIGTGTPTAKLDVAAGYIRARDDGSNNAPISGKGLELTATGGASYLTSYDRDAGNYTPLHIVGTPVDFPQGNVGIGTASPTSALEVGAGGELRLRDASGNRYGRLMHSDTGNFHIDSVGGGSIFLNWYGGNGVIVGN